MIRPRPLWPSLTTAPLWPLAAAPAVRTAAATTRSTIATMNLFMISPFGVVDLSQRQRHRKRSRRSPRGPANDAVGAAHRSGIARPKVGLSGCGCPIGARGARGRVACAGASCRARGARSLRPRSWPTGLRSKKRARRVRAKRCGRGGGAGRLYEPVSRRNDLRAACPCLRRAHSCLWAPRRPPPALVAIGLAVVPLELFRRTLSGCSRVDLSGSGRKWRSDADQDVVGLADRARRSTGLPRLEEQPLLRSVAAQTLPACSSRSEPSTRDATSLCGRAVSPKVFTALTVPRQRVGRDQASSGEKVLVGTVKSGG